MPSTGKPWRILCTYQLYDNGNNPRKKKIKEYEEQGTRRRSNEKQA